MPLSKWERLKSKQFSPCLNVIALLANFIEGKKKKKKKETMKIHSQAHVSGE